MDKTTKFLLGLIAVALIGINIQMWDGKMIKDAEAQEMVYVSGGYVDCYVKNWPRGLK